jgi:hypothetical protein
MSQLGGRFEQASASHVRLSCTCRSVISCARIVRVLISNMVEIVKLITPEKREIPFEQRSQTTKTL